MEMGFENCSKECQFFFFFMSISSCVKTESESEIYVKFVLPLKFH